jgi:hypothetical protein
MFNVGLKIDRKLTYILVMIISTLLTFQALSFLV